MNHALRVAAIAIGRPRWRQQGFEPQPFDSGWLGDRFVRDFIGASEWRVGLDRALAHSRADGNARDKERDRLTKVRL